MEQQNFRRAVVVSKTEGLHARPAELFANLAQKFESKIEVIKNDQRVDAKSILQILTLAVEAGTTIQLEAVGHDAETALDKLAELVESDFAVDGRLNEQQST